MYWVIVGSGGERGVGYRLTICTGPVKLSSRSNLTGLLIHSSSKQCWPMATGEELLDREDREEGGWQTVSSSKKRKERERMRG